MNNGSKFYQNTLNGSNTRLIKSRCREDDAGDTTSHRDFLDTNSPQVNTPVRPNLVKKTFIREKIALQKKKTHRFAKKTDFMKINTKVPEDPNIVVNTPKKFKHRPYDSYSVCQEDKDPKEANISLDSFLSDSSFDSAKTLKKLIRESIYEYQEAQKKIFWRDMMKLKEKVGCSSEEYTVKAKEPGIGKDMRSYIKNASKMVLDPSEEPVLDLPALASESQQGKERRDKDEEDDDDEEEFNIFGEEATTKPKTATTDQEELNKKNIFNFLAQGKISERKVNRIKKKEEFSQNFLKQAFMGFDPETQKGVIVNFKTDIEEPNHKKLEDFINRHYLRTNEQKEYKFLDVLFKIPNGSIFFCKRAQKTLFDSSGTGIPLYFIFLKTLIFFLIIASLTSVYLMHTNRQSFFKNKKFQTTVNSYFSESGILSYVQNWLVTLTLAPISSMLTSTYGFRLSSKNINIPLSCQTGVISSHINNFNFGLINLWRVPETVNNIFDISCTDWASITYSLQNCQGKADCDLQYNPSWILKECQNSDYFEKYNGYLKILCIDPAVNGKDAVISQYETYNLVSFGLIMLFQFFTIWLYLNEFFYKRQYQKRYRSPNEYSLALKNIPSQFTTIDLYKHVVTIFDRFAEKYYFRGNPLIDIKVAHSKKLLQYIREASDVNLSLQKELKRLKKLILMDLCKTKLASSHLNVDKERKRLQEEISKLSDQKRIDRKIELLEKLEKVEKLVKQSQKLKEIMHNSKGEEKIKTVFVTFQRIKDRNFFLSLLSKNFNHFLARFSETRKAALIEKGAYLYAEEPPLPANVIWKSYSFTERQIFTRRFFSWISYFMLYLIPLILLFILNQSKNDTNSKFPVCNYSTVDAEKDIFTVPYLLQNGPKMTDQQVECFCMHDFVTPKLLLQIDHSGNFCDEIHDSQMIFNILVTIEAVIINILSFVFDYLYIYMAQIEAHYDQNACKSSIITKLFLWKAFVNVAIPVISSFYLYYFGRYDEFTSRWYLDQGINIQITSFVRVFVLALVGLFRYAFPRLLAWYDRRWKQYNCVTRQITHIEYQRVYTNDEFDPELSFSEACTSILTVLTFGFMLPTLYVACLLQLVVLFYRDKLLVMNTYIFLSNFDSRLHKYGRNLLKYAFVLALLAWVWVFSNQDAFGYQYNHLQVSNPFKIDGVITRANHFVYSERGASAISFDTFNMLIRYTKLNFEAESGTKSTSILDNNSNVNQPISRYGHLPLNATGLQILEKSIKNFSFIYKKDLVGKDYLLTLRQRIETNSISKWIIFFTIVYFVLDLIRILCELGYEAYVKSTLKKGIHKYSDTAPKDQFEDLVRPDEIVDICAMWKVMEGRGAGLRRVREIHMSRIKRLRRIWRRKFKKGKTLQQLGDILGGVVGAKNVQKKKATDFEVEPQFHTLAVYDFKFDPSYRNYYLKNVKKDNVIDTEQEMDDDSEFFKMKKNTANIFGNLIYSVKNSTNPNEPLGNTNEVIIDDEVDNTDKQEMTNMTSFKLEEPTLEKKATVRKTTIEESNVDRRDFGQYLIRRNDSNIIERNSKKSATTASANLNKQQ